MEYLTVAMLRAEFGEDIESQTDAALQRRLDWLTAALEAQLGHGFGRALLLESTGTISVTVTATELTLTSGITDTDYTFAAYPTLGALVDVINAGGLASVTPMTGIAPDTPSTLLKARAVAVCGPTYDKRQVLDLSSWYICLSAKHESHLFLPLPVRSVTAVTENAIALAATGYYAPAGKPWLIRRTCGCVSPCAHRGEWLATYPGNVTVTFLPSWWGVIPGPLSQALLEAFSSASGLTGISSESFGKYSYSRGSAPVASWNDILSSGTVRQYAVKYAP